ncbi:Obtusifoliol 14-alpha demethylase [Tetrabaena socialis]|uniref:Obtusifoliol 14-alpha demethylase n=1 Tax=Tetrabaena socialis TaxID=47790 RepID=A0A2J7ZNB8_9CHLO|nr:Obtusifoliol 14-alpha demethylase [Tetrabaena socialis]|eukprot:PNH01769.1 Obtusifoliol 14-alpha demethylase [Tetrabaena socialis]
MADLSAELFALVGKLSIGQLVLASFGVLILTLVVGRLLFNSLPSKRPPVFEGIPYIGGFLKFSKGPWKLMEDGYAKYGDVFTVPVAHKRCTFLIGPDVSPHFFKAGDDEMSQSEVYNFNIPTFGPGVVYDVDQKVRTEQFRMFTEALTKNRLMAYVPQFVKEAEDYFAKWGNEGIVDFKDEFSKLVTLTAARTLLGREVRENLFEKVSDLLHGLDEGMVPLSVFFPNAPIAVHKKRDRCRKELADIFAKVIRARRASGRREEDVLQQFVDAKYQNVNGGRSLTEEEITGLLIAVLFAGQHTSSITTAWTGIFMVANKDEVVMASPNFSHMLPHVFPEPTRYDPDRFAPPRLEQNKPYGFIGFGAGRHACIGQNFAYLQIKSIWSMLLRNFDFELLDPVPAADFDSMVIGPKACRVKYTRRALA